MHHFRRLILPLPSYETVDSIRCTFMLISQCICVSRHQWCDHIASYPSTFAIMKHTRRHGAGDILHMRA